MGGEGAAGGRGGRGGGDGEAVVDADVRRRRREEGGGGFVKKEDKTCLDHPAFIIRFRCVGVGDEE